MTADVGHEIRNEDGECEEVKELIVKVEKVEYLLGSYLAGQSHNREQREELKQYKTNL